MMFCGTGVSVRSILSVSSRYLGLLSCSCSPVGEHLLWNYIHPMYWVSQVLLPVYGVRFINLLFIRMECIWGKINNLEATDLPFLYEIYCLFSVSWWWVSQILLLLDEFVYRQLLEITCLSIGLRVANIDSSILVQWYIAITALSGLSNWTYVLHFSYWWACKLKNSL